MSDRPTPSNGKRYLLWGTLHACPVCGACLCFACHPQGPCVDERDRPVRIDMPQDAAAHSAGTATN